MKTDGNETELSSDDEDYLRSKHVTSAVTDVDEKPLLSGHVKGGLQDFNKTVLDALADIEADAPFFSLVTARHQLVGGNIRSLLFDARVAPMIKKEIDVMLESLNPRDLEKLSLVDIGGEIPSSLYSINVVPTEENDSCSWLYCNYLY